ncbi:unnamed protein product, partial [Scytosiphon promiscuus]
MSCLNRFKRTMSICSLAPAEMRSLDDLAIDRLSLLANREARGESPRPIAIQMFGLARTSRRSKVTVGFQQCQTMYVPGPRQDARGPLLSFWLCSPPDTVLCFTSTWANNGYSTIFDQMPRPQPRD